jgi:hypothetical protein
MTHFDLHIITCRATAQRLQSLLVSLSPIINHPLLAQCRLIASNDIGWLDDNVFSSLAWDLHVNQISHILALNIRDCSKVYKGEKLGISAIMENCREMYFPMRNLRESEKSLLWKHYKSLDLVARPTLVLEDDAHLEEGGLCILEALLQETACEQIYIDLGYMNGLSKRGMLVESANGICFYRLNTAMTRTTTAFLVTPIAAQALSRSFWPCSLPADIHLQYLLFKQNISGIWPVSTVFTGMSTVGSLQSSIQ